MKLIIKLILFTLIIYNLQVTITHFFPPHVEDEIRKEERSLNQKKDVFYFGDSVLYTFSLTDSDKRPIPSMLESDIPPHSVQMIYHPADFAPVYDDYCHYLSNKPYKPKIIIIPISMRNFSLEWENNPVKQFEEERLYFRYKNTPIYPFLSFLISFNVFKLYPRTPEEFNNLPFVYKGQSLGTIHDFTNPTFSTYSDDHMKRQIKLFYYYDLPAADPVLYALKNLPSDCHFSKLIFYITPINFELGEKFLGNTFKKQVETNISVLKSVLSKNHISVLDLSHSLPSSSFFWQDELYMNEHLNEQGRAFVASHLAEKIKPILKQ